jgi:hypothetical protein
VSTSESNQRITASAGGEDRIDFMNLDIFWAAPGNNFDELNHEFDIKSISQLLNRKHAHYHRPKRVATFPWMV